MRSQVEVEGVAEQLDQLEVNTSGALECEGSWIARPRIVTLVLFRWVLQQLESYNVRDWLGQYQSQDGGGFRNESSKISGQMLELLMQGPQAEARCVGALLPSRSGQERLGP